MPYAGSWKTEKLKEAAVAAGRLGWTMSFHNDWSWYQVGETELVLFRRTTPHEQVLQEWESSFLRWIVENRGRLSRSGGPARLRLLEDIASCQHLPLSLSDFDDCRERYLREYASHLYDDIGSDMSEEFRVLMQKWREQGHKPLGVVAANNSKAGPREPG